MCGSEERSGLFCFAQRNQGEDNCYEDKKVLLALGDWLSSVEPSLCCLAYSVTAYLENSSGSRRSVWKVKTGKTVTLSRAYSRRGEGKPPFSRTSVPQLTPDTHWHWGSPALRLEASSPRRALSPGCFGMLLCASKASWADASHNYCHWVWFVCRDTWRPCWHVVHSGISKYLLTDAMT